MQLATKHLFCHTHKPVWVFACNKSWYSSGLTLTHHAFVFMIIHNECWCPITAPVIGRQTAQTAKSWAWQETPACTVCIRITWFYRHCWQPKVVCLVGPLQTCVYIHVNRHICRYCSQIATPVCSKARCHSVSSRASPQGLTWLQETWELFQIIQWRKKKQKKRWIALEGSLAGVENDRAYCLLLLIQKNNISTSTCCMVMMMTATHLFLNETRVCAVLL